MFSEGDVACEHRKVMSSFHHPASAYGSEITAKVPLGVAHLIFESSSWLLYKLFYLQVFAVTLYFITKRLVVFSVSDYLLTALLWF